MKTREKVREARRHTCYTVTTGCVGGRQQHSIRYIKKWPWEEIVGPHAGLGMFTSMKALKEFAADNKIELQGSR